MDDFSSRSLALGRSESEATSGRDRACGLPPLLGPTHAT